MAKKSTSRTKKSKQNNKAKTGLLTSPKFSKKYVAIFGAVFALVGSYFLYSAFAAQRYINYFGTLTPQNRTASYKVSTGAGEMDIRFTNNTADVTLTVKNDKGETISAIDSRGRRAVTLKTQVVPGVYTFDLNPNKSFTKGRNYKGYSVKINYPERDTTNPSIAIIDPFNEETVSKTSFMSAKVSDDSGIAKVVMFANDKKIKDDYEAPYDSRWDTRQFEDGPVTIVMKAYDLSGNVSEASGTVIVDNVEDIVARFPGDPNPQQNNKSYWGSSIGGNGDPARHEDPTGASLSMRRTFYQWQNGLDANSAMWRNIQDDLNNDRLPFVSIKTPGWQAVADGKHDAELDQIIERLDAYEKPIWFVVHHEPEGGGGKNFPDDPGGPAAWRGMQIKVRERLDAARTDNVAFMPVLMAYTWNPTSNRNPDDWWVEGIWDAYCVDHYQENESRDILNVGSWQSFVDWAEDRNMPFCLGEWGNRGTNAQAGQEMRDFWEWTFNDNKDMIGYAYFDSGLNSPNGSWELKGEQLKVFRDILKNDSRVQRISELQE